MLGLKLPTDPRWVNIVEKNIEEILTDHAFCEIKASSTAISLMVSFPEFTELVQGTTIVSLSVIAPAAKAKAKPKAKPKAKKA